MNYGLWLSAAGLQTNQYRMAITANNLANADTVGFKKDLAVTCQRRIEAREGGGVGLSHPVLDGQSGGSFVAPTYHDFTQGEIETTGRPLDVAILGDGFFGIEKEGREYFMRDGRFVIDDSRHLVTAAGGWPVMNTERVSIVIPSAGTGPVRITPDGDVMQGNEVVGRLGMFALPDERQFRKIGANLFAATGGRPEVTATNVRPGALERSTVNPVESLAGMIEMSRALELNAAMISLQDTMLSRTVNDVGRIG